MSNITSKQWESINDFVRNLNSESSIAEMQKSSLHSLRNLIPHDSSFFNLGKRKNGKPEFFNLVPFNFEKKFLKLYFEKYQYQDTMLWFFSQGKNTVYRESDFINEKMQKASAFYSEWLSLQNIYYSMGCLIDDGNTLYGSVNLWRSNNHGDFSDRELKIMEILTEHLLLWFKGKFPMGVTAKSSNDYAASFAEAYRLTPKELEIANLIYEGRSIREACDILDITENTVKKHTTHIFRKANIKSRGAFTKLMREHIDACKNG